MYKLNNRGWGLGVFLVYMFVFILAIFIITVLINKNGLGSNSENIMTTEEERTLEYEKYEQIVRDSAIDYREENYPYISDEEEFKINITLLDIPNEITRKCEGYVIIEKNSEGYNYSPYLKCGSYNTPGYN